MEGLVYIPDEELEQFINYKLVESIINGEVLPDLKNNPSAIQIMQNEYFIDMLSMFVDENVKTNRVDSKQKKIYLI